MGLLCVIYMILALRTNLIFFLIFLTLIPAFACLAGAFFHLAQDPVGNAVLGNRLIYASGACSFVTCLLGWYLFLSIMMASLDFPVGLPGEFPFFFLFSSFSSFLLLELFFWGGFWFGRFGARLLRGRFQFHCILFRDFRSRMKHAADAVSIYYYSLRSHETFPQRDGAGIGPEEEEDVRGLNELMDRCFGFSFLLFFRYDYGMEMGGKRLKKGRFSCWIEGFFSCRKCN
jgi:hypothetical protein